MKKFYFGWCVFQRIIWAENNKVKQKRVKLKLNMNFDIQYMKYVLIQCANVKIPPAKKLNFISLTLIKWNQIYNLFSKNAVL